MQHRAAPLGWTWSGMHITKEQYIAHNYEAGEVLAKSCPPKCTSDLATSIMFMAITIHDYHVNRFWEKTSSYEQLKNWLSNNDSVIFYEQTVDEGDYNEDDHDGTIDVLCGNVNCKFGIKTYRYVGYSED